MVPTWSKTLNFSIQLNFYTNFLLQALTNISENPKIRKIMNQEYSHELALIQVGDDPDIKTWKDQLMGVIGWVP